MVSMSQSSFGIPVNIPNEGNVGAIMRKQQGATVVSNNNNVSTGGINPNQSTGSDNADYNNNNNGSLGSPPSGTIVASTTAMTTATTAVNGSSPSNTFSPLSSQYQNRDLQQRQRMMMMMQQQRALQQQQQQRQQQQQQAMQNYEAQLYQLLMTLNKRPKRIYNFVETPDAILKKYELYRPSIEFHIYEDNYRLCAPSNTRQLNRVQQGEKEGLILDKNDETSRSLLEYVARGRIPEAIMDVLRDSNIQFYEGNLILQVYDHTNTVDIYIKGNPKGTNNSNGNGNVNGNTDSNGVRSDMKQQAEGKQNDIPKNERRGPFKRPRVYRTLLRPNSLTHYHDLMTYTDQVRFSDSIYQQLEAEILNLTKRNLDLRVQLNPYMYRDILDEQSFTVPEWDETTQRMKFCHREESQAKNTKGSVGHISEHEDLPQHTSMYERLMLILSERTSTTTNAVAAARASLAGEPTEESTPTTVISPTRLSVAGSTTNLDGSTRGNNADNLQSGGGNDVNTTGIVTKTGAGDSNNTYTNSGNGSGNGKSKNNTVNTGVSTSNGGHEFKPFSRLKFIEYWWAEMGKRKRQQEMMMATDGNMGAVSPLDMKFSMTTPFLSQPQPQPQQQQQQQRQRNMSSQRKQRNSTAGQNGPNKQNGKRDSVAQEGTDADTTDQNGTAKGGKAKKPRRTKRAAPATTDGQPAPKKKRATKKKKNSKDADTNGNVNANVSVAPTAATVATPGSVTAAVGGDGSIGTPDRGIPSSTAGSPSFLVTPTINNNDAINS